MNNLLAELTKSQQASLGGGQQGRRVGRDGGQGRGQTYLKHCLRKQALQPWTHVALWLHRDQRECEFH